MRLGDLDALKKEFIKEFYTALGQGEDSFDVIGTMTKVIDNAPTVEHSLLPLASDLDRAYMRGYEVGKAEGILKASTRPQGKWLKSDIPESILAKCSLCGFNCGAYTHNFCPNCGADMKGDAE